MKYTIPLIFVSLFLSGCLSPEMQIARSEGVNLHHQFRSACDGVVNVLTLAMPNHNMMTITPMSNGDNAGLMMNPLSGMVMGPQKQLLGSVKTFMGGSPANKMLGLSGQNGMMPGAFGETLSPSQVKLMILS